ncbi:uncharacterized protein [Physcomitrium patens]|uniref:uncharacterized protein isoform X2 n=1 Tax=Physcomitrium patens TaxID=3218 RepID=UPI003CCE36B3
MATPIRDSRWSELFRKFQKLGFFYDGLTIRGANLRRTLASCLSPILSNCKGNRHGILKNIGLSMSINTQKYRHEDGTSVRPA